MKNTVLSILWPSVVVPDLHHINPSSVESEAGDAATQAKESSEDAPESEPPSVPSSPSGVNRRTSVLFTKKAGALYKVSGGGVNGTGKLD